jgi:hypothetical protein
MPKVLSLIKIKLVRYGKVTPIKKFGQYQPEKIYTHSIFWLETLIFLIIIKNENISSSNRKRGLPC